MGLLRDHNHLHSHDNSVRVNLPDTINVHEHKAPTDEAIRYMEDTHDKAIKNIVAKVRVEDNILKGEVVAFMRPWGLRKDLLIVYKFSINGQEFTIDQEVESAELINDGSMEICKMERALEDRLKALMLYYTLKKFVTIAYEQITNSPFPKELL